MTKFVSLLILVLLSLLVVFLIPEVRILLHWIADAHHFLIDKLAFWLGGGKAGRIATMVLALIIVPLFMALIPAFIYWLFRRRMMPEYLAVVWVIWFVLVTILAY